MSSSVQQPEAPHDAVLRGDEAAVRLWLERGGRANTAREEGKVIGVTLLMDAAVQGHERVAALLIYTHILTDDQNHPVFAHFRSFVKISEYLSGGFSPNLAQLIHHGP